VRREVLVLVSALARTDRHTATLAGRGGTLAGSRKSTCSHRRARAPTVRSPAAFAAAVSATAWARVMLRLGLPCCPDGVPVSAETFRSTRFLACALVIARVSARCAIATVELLRDAATAARKNRRTFAASNQVPRLGLARGRTEAYARVLNSLIIDGADDAARVAVDFTFLVA
jgi:hypothetical protein